MFSDSVVAEQIGIGSAGVWVVVGHVPLPGWFLLGVDYLIPQAVL